MADRHDLFPVSHREIEVSPDFEEKVWKKITKKKQRRMVGRITASVVLIATLPLGYRYIIIRSNTGNLAKSGIHSAAAAKEQVPLVENLVFGVSDQRTLYALEPVSYKTESRELRNEI